MSNEKRFCVNCGKEIVPASAGGDVTAFTNEPRYIGYHPCSCGEEDPMGFKHPGKFNNWTGLPKTQLTAQDECRALLVRIGAADSREAAEQEVREFMERLISLAKKSVEALPKFDCAALEKRVTELQEELASTQKQAEGWKKLTDVAQQERDNYCQAVESAHEMLNQCGILPRRDSSHRGLVDRIRIAQARYENVVRERDRVQALFSNMRDAEKKLSDAYIRVRQILGLDHFTAGTTPEQMWLCVEATAAQLVKDSRDREWEIEGQRAEIERLRTSKAALHSKTVFLESQRQYHMDQINRLAKRIGRLGETSEGVVTVAIATLDQCRAKAARFDESKLADQREALRPMSVNPPWSGKYLVGHRGTQKVVYWFDPKDTWHPGTKTGWQDSLDFNATHWTFIPGFESLMPDMAPR